MDRMTYSQGGPQRVYQHCLDVWGEFACFSRPEAKIERYSYPTITPSAARGVFDSIYVKPRHFRWQIDRIALLRAPAFIALRRNEVKDKVNVRSVTAWRTGKREPEPLIADGDRDQLGTDTKGRTQRQTMALRQPHYRIWAHIVPWPGHERQRAAFDGQFTRRAKHGKCVWQPYLGCREFPAFFELVPLDAPAVDFANVNLDIGYMLYDVFDLSRPGTKHDKPAISLFPAKIEKGVLEVPPFNDPAVHRVAEVA